MTLYLISFHEDRVIHLVLRAEKSLSILLSALLTEPSASIVLQFKGGPVQIYLGFCHCCTSSLPSASSASALVNQFCGSSATACINPDVLERMMFKLLIQLKLSQWSIAAKAN